MRVFSLENKEKSEEERDGGWRPINTCEASTPSVQECKSKCKSKSKCVSVSSGVSLVRRYSTIWYQSQIVGNILLVKSVIFCQSRQLNTDINRDSAGAQSGTVKLVDLGPDLLG
ncbi:hypothetical protein ACMD2_26652 [Ananas comosus]|uniref:Uncharacterized protein n=1 Tax=Ananas comosus TaxID=4615 RepID=A0A199UM56_ANACO|nr:hypothetical protein ACMD2_26652 [Ananas comosus]